MSALLGPHDLKNLALPLGWDGGELAKVAFADGTSYDAVIETLLAGLELANQGLLNEPILVGLASPTAEAMVEYREGTGHGMSERTEYQRAEARRAVTGGHMLPLKSYDRALGWTYDFLRKARPAQLEADIADALDDVRSNWERALLRRFFSAAENPIGAAGYDLPFAVGAGGQWLLRPQPMAGRTSAPTTAILNGEGQINRPRRWRRGPNICGNMAFSAPIRASSPLPMSIPTQRWASSSSPIRAWNMSVLPPMRPMPRPSPAMSAISACMKAPMA